MAEEPKQFPDSMFCRNPRCGEMLTPLRLRPSRVRLCPSCRLAGSYGAGAAAVAIFVVELIAWVIR